MPDPITDLVDELRNALETNNAIALNQLIRIYGGMFVGLQGDIDAFLADYESAEDPTKASVEALPSFNRLISNMSTALDDYEAVLRLEVSTDATANAGFGFQDSLLLIGAAVFFSGLSNQAAETGQPFDRFSLTISADQAGIIAGEAGFFSSEEATLEFLAELLDPNGELFRRIGFLGEFTTAHVADAILEGVALGRNPAKIAQDITNAFGIGLSDSMRIMRTSQLWSYRSATHSNYQANGIDEWIWWAELGGNTCMSCINQHGSVHPSSESLNDHHNGRCTALPVVDGFNSVTQTGQEWFEEMSEGEQIAQMGRAKWDAWQSGEIDFSSMTGLHEDGVYGTMRVEQSLKKILEGIPDE